jgi:hypothetical protein
MREPCAAAAAVVLSLVLAACGDAPATPAPSAPAVPDASPAASDQIESSLEPSAEPSPSPLDAATAAVAALSDPRLEATITIDSTTKVGRTTTRTAGSIDVSGRASHLVRTDKTGRTTTRTETMTANGTRYVRSKGVWTKAGAADDTDLLGMLRGITSFTDGGVEDRDGLLLHHLQATVAGIPRELALVTKGVTEATGVLDAWVEEDGSPVTMTLTSTWRQPDGTKTVDGSRTATLAFGEPLAEAPIIAPTETWAFFTSKRYHYRMAAPDTWSTKAGSGKLSDRFDGGEEIAYASRARSGGRSLAYVNDRILAQLRNITGYTKLKVTSNKKAKLGGLAARRIEFRGTSKGETVYGQAAFAVKGAFWYFVGFDSFTKWDDASRATFSSMLGSFEYR